MQEPRVTIIAELGINHDGDFQKALRMIRAAQDAGVKIVKFQHYDALKLLGPDSPYLAYAAQCQFSKTQHEQLAAYCDAIGMEYLVSVFDINDVTWADKFCRRHKVASRMNHNQDFISELVKTGKEVIISINNPIDFRPGLRDMYCVTQYPTSKEQLMSDVEKYCSSNLGLSSHCASIEPSLKAVSQGSNLLEHHVKLAGDEDGCDKSSSITFEQLRQLNDWANNKEVV